MARSIVNVVWVCICVTALLWSLRAAAAGWLTSRDDARSAALACRIESENADNWAHLAQVSDDGGKDRSAARERALCANPRAAKIAIELALEREIEDRIAESEGLLLRAAASAQTYEPRWSLANFYFRNRNYAAFWRWARQAAAVGPDDMAALFQLCWSVLPDAQEIRWRVTGSDTHALTALVNFLVTQGKLDQVRPIALELATARCRDTGPTLTTVCDKLIEAGRIDDAAQVWRASSAGGLTPYPMPWRDQGVQNAEFRTPPSCHGFDWCWLSSEGADMSALPADRGLRIELSGRQPDRARLLSQLVKLQPDTERLLRVRYSTAGLRERNGLSWQVLDANTGALIAAAITHPPADKTADCVAAFRVPSGNGAVRLILNYERQAGTTATTGFLSVFSVQITAYGKR